MDSSRDVARLNRCLMWAKSIQGGIWEAERRYKLLTHVDSPYNDKAARDADVVLLR